MARSVTVTIQPDNNPSGTQYQIERSKDQTFFTGTSVVRAWGTNRTHIDSVPEGFKYFYRAKAKDTDGDESDWSNVADVIVPVAQGQLQVVDTGVDKIDLIWDPIPEATSYTLKRDNAEIYSGTGTAFSDTGLSPGTEYTYTLIGSNALGAGTPEELVVKTDLEPPTITATT